MRRPVGRIETDRSSVGADNRRMLSTSDRPFTSKLTAAITSSQLSETDAFNIYRGRDIREAKHAK